MSDYQGYKTRAEAVRGAARAQLIRLRSERLARRRAEAQSSASVTNSTDQEGWSETALRPVDKGGPISVSRTMSAAMREHLGDDLIEDTVAGTSIIPPADSDILPAGETWEADFAEPDAPEPEGSPDPTPPQEPVLTEASSRSGPLDDSRTQTDCETEAPASIVDMTVDAPDELGESQTSRAAGEQTDMPPAIPSDVQPDPSPSDIVSSIESQATSDAPAQGSSWSTLGRAEDAPVHSPHEPSTATVSLTDTSEPPLQASRPNGREASSPSLAIADSDLSRLPGAGAGLIWMLFQCKVTSLSDLAASDPEVLAARMGLVGQIIDLAGWIAFARAQDG